MALKENLINLLMLIEDMRYLRTGISECADHLISCGVTIPVRCKDCKFFHDKGYCTLVFGLCRIKPEEDFCSHGERKDNG